MAKNKDEKLVQYDIDEDKVRAVVERIKRREEQFKRMGMRPFGMGGMAVDRPEDQWEDEADSVEDD